MYACILQFFTVLVAPSQCSSVFDCLCVHLQLLMSAAVHRWGIDIQEGIFDMLQLLIDLIATRLRYEPVPVDLLHVLAMVRGDV